MSKLKVARIPKQRFTCVDCNRVNVIPKDELPACEYCGKHQPEICEVCGYKGEDVQWDLNVFGDGGVKLCNKCDAIYAEAVAVGEDYKVPDL